MKSMIRLLLVVAMVAMSSGCYSTHVYRSSVQPTPRGGSTFVHTFFGGLVSVNAVDADMMCGGAPVHSVHSHLGLTGWLAGTITMFIWVPMTVSVTCGEMHPAGTVSDALDADPETWEGDAPL